MRCDQALPYLERYADGELRGWRRLLISRHLHACPACAARRDQLFALRARIRAEVPRFAAPVELRAKVKSLLDAPSATRPRPGHRWRWAAAGALAGSCLTVLLWLTGNAVLNQRADEDIARAVVNAHVRATLDGRLTEVASSDRHTVKPWLSARLDYSPPVRDLAAAGFPLIGARLEHLGGRPVATLAYRYREHTVDVFVRPDWLQSRSRAPQTIRGFNVVTAEAQGMDWLIVSDANVDALASLVRQLAAGAGP